MAGANINFKIGYTVDKSGLKDVENSLRSLQKMGLNEYMDLNRSLNISELSTLNTLTLSYETDKFKLPTMYFVATNKLLSDADLSVFNKLDGLNSKVDELQTNMNKIDNGASDLSKGINKLKNSLSSSITNLKNNNEDALD